MWLLARLPMSWIFALGKTIGVLGYHLARSRRRIAEVNIARCFPTLDAEQRQHLVRANFRHTGMGVVEMALRGGPVSASSPPVFRVDSGRSATATPRVGM